MKKPKEDIDVKVLIMCVVALNRCSSRRMLKATLEFLYDRFIRHPSQDIPDHLK